jgi:hypothetical protein
MIWTFYPHVHFFVVHGTDCFIIKHLLTILHFACTRRTETIPSTGVFYRNTIIEGYLEDGFAIIALNGLCGAIGERESDLGHREKGKGGVMVAQESVY